MESKRGVVNLHGNLLSKYRGATPPIAPWMTIDNEKYIGMTLHYINKGCDTGNDIYQ